MTPEEHKERHKKLHAALDEVFADYIQHHPEQHIFFEMPLSKLINWSFEQTSRPTPNPHEKVE